jgi:lipopolysaccharide export system protein LptA
MAFIQKIWVWIVALLVIGWLAWLIFFPKESFESKIRKTLERQKNRADLLLKDVTFSESFGGTKFWELDAETAVLNQDQGGAELKPVKGRFYKNNTPVLFFIAPKVLWNMRDKEIVIEHPFGYDQRSKKYFNLLSKLIDPYGDPARIFKLATRFSGMVPGAWFLTNRLKWQLSTQKLESHEGVLFNQGALTVFAQDLASDVGFDSLSLTGDPIALYIQKTPNAPLPKITTTTARKFLINTAKNQVSAVDNVVISQKETEIRSRQAAYLPENQLIVLTDAVKLSFKDIRASCKKAFYNPADNTVILEGSAAASRDRNLLRGEKIAIDLKTGKINVLGKTKIVIDERELKK